jgi:hypothetical protein
MHPLRPGQGYALRVLLERRAEVVGHNELMRPGTSRDTLRRDLGHLRELLKDVDADLEIVRGSGYRLRDASAPQPQAVTIGDCMLDADARVLHHGATPSATMPARAIRVEFSAPERLAGPLCRGAVTGVSADAQRHRRHFGVRLFRRGELRPKRTTELLLGHFCSHVHALTLRTAAGSPSSIYRPWVLILSRALISRKGSRCAPFLRCPCTLLTVATIPRGRPGSAGSFIPSSGRQQY